MPRNSSMLQQILKDVQQEVKFGYLKKKHPFRYPVLASIEDGKPQQRTVVLRNTTDDFHLVLFTDARSAKMSQFAKNSAASMLFYHPKKLMQVKVQGNIKVVSEKNQIQEYWQKIQGNSERDFRTVDSPGTPLKNPDHVSFSEDQHHFCVLELVPNQIEYLQLKRPHHLRALYSVDDNWKGQFLNP
jgi:pyridoxine/pyridoxamine 5'-phosphate oxidase